MGESSSLRRLVLTAGNPGRALQGLPDALSKIGYEVVALKDLPATLSLIASGQVAALVIGPEVPYFKALDFCRDKTFRGNTLVVMSIESVDPLDVVIALEVGADDVVITSSDAKLAISRVKALLRRQSREAIPRLGGWKLEPLRRHAVTPDRRLVNLTTAELAMLEFFLATPGTVHDESSAAAALGMETSVALRNAVVRLRKRLAAVGQDNLITTIRGKGYGYLPHEGG